LYKLESNIPITKYDLPNDGNLGRNGDEKIINYWGKTCKQEKCIFILSKTEQNNKYSQINKKMLNYVMTNYEEKSQIDRYSVYESEVIYEK